MGSHTSDPDIQTVLDCLRQIVRARRVFDRQAEKRFGISGAQLFVLQKLVDGEAISINELAERTHTHQSSVSVVVRKLVTRRFIGRSFSATDGRRVELRLSQRGRRLLRAAPPAAQDRLIASLAAFPKIRRRRLGELLAELIRETGIVHGPPTLFFENQTPRRRRRRALKTT
jgi:DNA-binding MarR family transcriptional regulator